MTTHQIALIGAGSFGALRFAPDDTTDADAAADANAMHAAPILALRAARRAIAENPDHPDGYYALAQVLRDTDLPLSESERTLGIVTAYRQCLERLPKPERYRRGQFATIPTEAAFQLATTYLKPRYRQDAKGQSKLMGFLGMPIDVAPLNELCGQVLFENNQGQLERALVIDLATGTAKLSRGAKRVTETPHFLPLDAAREVLKLALEYAPIDLGNDAGERAQDAIKPIETLLKDVERAVILGHEQYDQQVRGRGLRQMVDAARRNGLMAEALRLLIEKGSELEAEYKDDAAYAAVLRVGLQLALGHIESANSDLLDGLNTPEWTVRFERVNFVPRVLQLKYVTALLAGDYKTAGDLWEVTAGNGVGVLANLPPPGPNIPRSELLRVLSGGRPTPEAENLLKSMLDPPLVPLSPLTQLTQRPVWEMWQESWLRMGSVIRQQIAGQMQGEAAFFYRRGVLSLLEGDITAAKQRFQQSTRTAPKGWGLTDIVPAEAVQYLRLIEIAEKSAAP